MRKTILIIAMAALVCWLPGQAMATTTFDSTFNVLGTHNFTPTADAGNYGSVQVSLSSSGKVATITITPSESPVDLDIQNGSGVYGIALNVANPAGETFSTSWVSASGWAFSGPASFDGLGTLNLIGQSDDTNIDSVVITITVPDGGSWATAAAVLTADSSGIDAGAYTYVEGASSDTAYIGEGTLSTVPLASTGLLLGSGLLGLVALGWRKRTAFEL